MEDVPSNPPEPFGPPEASPGLVLFPLTSTELFASVVPRRVVPPLLAVAEPEGVFPEFGSEWATGNEILAVTVLRRVVRTLRTVELMD